jgi:hypothetical protein
MGTTRVLAVSAVALTAALAGTDAFAKGAVTAPLADYNSAQVKTAGGTITVPFGAILANAVYTVAAGTVLDTGSRFTVTLPSGFLFQSVPALTAPGTTTITMVGGGIGAGSTVFQINTANVAAGGTLSLGEFTLSGATPLESAFGGNVLPMTFQSTNNSSTANNDPAPLSVPVFANAVGSLPDTITPGSGAINLESTPPGTQFIPAGATIAGSAQVATFAINTELQDPFNANAPVLSPDGLANSLNPADTVNIIVEGNFSGIATAYADPTVTTCADTVPAGAISATVTSGSLTFTGVTINTAVQICMIPDGATLLQPSTNPYVYTYNAGSSTDFFGGLAQTTAGNFYTYTGGTSQAVTNFFTGTDSGYTTLLRVNNAGKGTASVIAEFQPYSGGDLLIGDLGSIAPGTGTIFTLAQIEADIPGLDLANSGQRATLTIIGTGLNTNVSASAILVNPGGLINNVD